MAVHHADCPECGEPIVFSEEVQIGDIVNCSECFSDLEVADMDDEEIVLELVSEEEWEDEDL